MSWLTAGMVATVLSDMATAEQQAGQAQVVLHVCLLRCVPCRGYCLSVKPDKLCCSSHSVEAKMLQPDGGMHLEDDCLACDHSARCRSVHQHFILMVSKCLIKVA